MFDWTKMIKCKICKHEIRNCPDHLCDRCWEVMHRIDEFLSHDEGRKLILKKIEKTKKS